MGEREGTYMDGSPIGTDAAAAIRRAATQRGDGQGDERRAREAMGLPVFQIDPLGESSGDATIEGRLAALLQWHYANTGQVVTSATVKWQPNQGTLAVLAIGVETEVHFDEEAFRSAVPRHGAVGDGG